VRHRTEYAIEAFALGMFMVSASAVSLILDHPSSPVPHLLPDPFVRRMLGGVAMGLTAIALVYSPWGRRSGAHLNPAFTLTFWRLGKVAPADAAGYVAAQFLGAFGAMLMLKPLVGSWLDAPAVSWVTTRPGPLGTGAAFAAELAISFGLMTTVLVVSSRPRLARFTGVFGGLLVASYITIEAPLSGMSMNPARTLGPALISGVTDALWVYFTAPPLGMLAAAQLFVSMQGRHRIPCAKWHHDSRAACIHCGMRPQQATESASIPRGAAAIEN
jgi:aquaporin Z